MDVQNFSCWVRLSLVKKKWDPHPPTPIPQDPHPPYTPENVDLHPIPPYTPGPGPGAAVAGVLFAICLSILTLGGGARGPGSVRRYHLTHTGGGGAGPMRKRKVAPRCKRQGWAGQVLVRVGLHGLAAPCV